MRVVSYNIHRAVGSRGRPSIRAIAEVVSELKPDLVALNEVVRTPVLADQPARLAGMLKMSHAFSRTTRSYGMVYGNAVLVRGRLLDKEEVPLPAMDAEPRSVLFVDVEIEGMWLTFGCTHLEPRPTPRTAQLEALASLVADVRGLHLLGGGVGDSGAAGATDEARTPGAAGTTGAHPAAGTTGGCPLILAGDLNAAPSELEAFVSATGLELAPPLPTFPATGPLASIDHVLFTGHWRPTGSFTVEAPVSDHAAFVVDLERV